MLALGSMAYGLALQCALGQTPMPAAARPYDAHARTALLYSDQLTLLPNGEPMVRIGLGTEQTQVQLRIMHHTAHMTYGDNTGALHTATLHADQIITFQIAQSTPAQKRYYVDLGRVESNPHLRDARLASWRAAGFQNVTTMETGTLIGTQQRILDTRAFHVVIWATDQQDATRILARVQERDATHATLRWDLQTRPTALLYVLIDGKQMGTAVDTVHIVPWQHHGDRADLQGLTGLYETPNTMRTYHGEIDVVVDSRGQLATVNTVGVETILRGVVPAEIFASAAPEALKAQAIAARNTMLASVGHRHHTDPFHLCNTQHCQMYTGHNSEDARTNQAIRATRGQVLFLGGQLVDAVYSSTCGGHTEDNDVVWSDAPNPALRGRPDYPTTKPSQWQVSHAAAFQPYCARASFADPKRIFWQHVLPITALQRTVDVTYPHVGKVIALEAGNNGPGGRLHHLTVTGDQGVAVIQRELPIRRWLSNLRSAAMTVQPLHDRTHHLTGFVFDGVGWGHGVGMCQMGAIGRAEAGHSYGTILAHYYNGAQIHPLY